MKTEARKIWQMAAGDTDRNYADLCLRWGIIVLGPGRHGHMLKTPNIVDRLKSDGISDRMIRMLKKFSTEVKAGDIVVLRLGRSEVHGVGVVHGEYGWHDALSDIDGWDLHHYYSVEWIWAKPQGKPKIFKDALKFGDSLQGITKTEKSAELLSWIATLSEPSNNFSPQRLPRYGEGMSIDTLCQLSYDYGIALNNLSGLKDCISELQTLARWYQTYSSNPSEHETMTHLIVPLLKALGWTPQRIALEYHQTGKGRADVALYSYGNRKPEYLTAIVEAKKFQRSCLKAEAQVKGYAADNTNRLIVTDGIRYGVFVKDSEGQFRDVPSAYLNLTQLRGAYPIYGEGCAGADAALWLMNADWQPNLPKPGTASKEFAA